MWYKMVQPPLAVASVHFVFCLVYLASEGGAAVGDFCTDVSYWDVPKYQTTIKQCCETELKQRCTFKSDHVCKKVPEIQCEVVSWPLCESTPTLTESKKCEVRYRDYSYVHCKDVKSSITHTKKVPECREITKENCVTDWKIDANGNKVWSGKETCTPVRWEECGIVERQVELPMMRTDCSAGSIVKWVDIVDKTKHVTGLKTQCQIKSSVDCKKKTVTKCASVSWEECSMVPVEECQPVEVYTPSQEKVHRKNCFNPNAAAAAAATTTTTTITTTITTIITTTTTTSTGVSDFLSSEDQTLLLGSASPNYKDTCPDKADLSAVLLENNWRTQSTIAAMSEDEKKNTVIVEVGKRTRHTGADLQGRSIAGDLGSLTAIANMAVILIKYSNCISDVKTMTYELHMRNLIIIAISKHSSIQVGTLEHLNDHQLLNIFCRGIRITEATTPPINCEGLGLKGDDELRLYEHVEEAGRSLTIYGPANLQLRNFNDLASSVHAIKGNWELYVHSDYSGNRMVVEEGQKINTDRSDEYSSARPICKYYDDRSTALLKVYRDVSSQGDKKEFSNEKGDLGDDSDKISSVHVVKGDWELYEHINYHGVREVVREGDQIDIQHNDFHSSLRPICETYTYSTKCTPVRFEILEDPVSQFKGTKIIGSASGFSCNDPSTQTLTLNNVNSVTKSISLSASKSLGTDWSFGASATVTGSVGFLGSGTEVSATVSYSTGGSFSITHQTTESVTKGDSKLVGSSTTYQTPGAAIAFGTVDIRETDSSEVPVKIHLNCTADGKNFKLEEKLSTMKLTSQTFQSADFFAFVKKIDNAEDCNKNGFISKTDKCIRDVKDRYFNVFGEKEQMRKDFNDCFA